MRLLFAFGRTGAALSHSGEGTAAHLRFGRSTLHGHGGRGLRGLRCTIEWTPSTMAGKDARPTSWNLETRA